MRCPKLTELPAPSPGKTGWPWTVESQHLPETMPDGSPWPRITIVTPSFNYAAFIEETIRSVLLQGYPDLEYLVLDGGSKDDSVEIIKRYSPWLAYWASGPDKGQSDAINRGLKMGSGLFATWINSDDMLYRNALAEHASQIGFNNDVVYIGLCAYMDRNGRILSMHRSKVHSLEDLLRVPQLWRRGGNVVQPEVLFPRKLAIEVGGLNPDNHYSMDYELWGKLLLAGAKLQHTNIPFGMLRRHPGQKISDGLRLTDSLIDTALRLVREANGLSLETKSAIETELQAYHAGYPDRHWKGTGRLARWGLPRPIVTGLRSAFGWVFGDRS